MSSDPPSAIPEGWTSHVAPTGHTYYYHAATKRSTYKKPEPDLPAGLQVEDKLGAQPNISPSVDRENPLTESLNIKQVHPTTSATRNSSDRPKYKEAIIGAEPWLQVTTRKGRTFYHDPETRESCWDVPEQISDAVNRWHLQADKVELPAQTSLQYDPHPDYEYEEVLEVETDQLDAELTKAPEQTEFNEDDIEWQLAELEEVGEGMLQAEEDNLPEFTPQEQLTIFQKMLSDRQVDPFRTWDSEIEKIASDPRYLVLANTRQRKLAFEDYCTNRAKELQELKAAIPTGDPKDGFLELVNQSFKKTPYFLDFKRKYKKEAAYKAYGNSDHEREKLFRSFVDLQKSKST